MALKAKGEGMKKDESGTLLEWVYPFAFFVCAGWAVWHAPAYLLDFIPPDSQSLQDQMSQLHPQGCDAGMARLSAAMLTSSTGSRFWLPVLGVLGARNVRCAPMEYQDWHRLDRLAIFVGRVTMMMIISMTMVMLYEVFLRYVVEAPTLWANELDTLDRRFRLPQFRLLCHAAALPHPHLPAL